MVQIGNVHIGKAQSAKLPNISIQEAVLIWDLLAARYKCIEETNIYLNYAHDPEFKLLITKMGMKLLEYQAAELERQCQLYGIPMPSRPPKNVTLNNDNMIFNDRFMFMQIFEGCQHFIDVLAKCIRSTVHNDALRDIFCDFFNGELAIFNNLCKYGKMKGYLNVEPTYISS